MSVSVPTENPSPLDDNYVYYLFLGGIKGEKVKNPNLRGRHYIIQNDEPKYLTQRTTTLIGAEPVNIIHFDYGNRKDVIPSQYENVTLDDEFTFDENMTIYGTLFYPMYQIQGISTDWESPNAYTLPTSLAVSSLVAARLDAASEDLKDSLQVIASNAQLIAAIQNSTGGLEDKNDASYNWVMWTYIKKWIIKGFNDFIKGKNDVAKWGENFPNAKYDYDKLNELLKVCKRDHDWLDVTHLKVRGWVIDDLGLEGGDLDLVEGDIKLRKGDIELEDGDIYLEDGKLTPIAKTKYGMYLRTKVILTVNIH